MGAFIMVAGLYASIDSIVQGMHEIQSLLYSLSHLVNHRVVAVAGYRAGTFPGPFTCVNQALT